MTQKIKYSLGICLLMTCSLLQMVMCSEKIAPEDRGYTVVLVGDGHINLDNLSQQRAQVSEYNRWEHFRFNIRSNFCTDHSLFTRQLSEALRYSDRYKMDAVANLVSGRSPECPVLKAACCLYRIRSIPASSCDAFFSLFFEAQCLDDIKQLLVFVQHYSSSGDIKNDLLQRCKDTFKGSNAQSLEIIRSLNKDGR